MVYSSIGRDGDVPELVMVVELARATEVEAPARDAIQPPEAPEAVAAVAVTTETSVVTGWSREAILKISPR